MPALLNFFKNSLYSKVSEPSISMNLKITSNSDASTYTPTLLRRFSNSAFPILPSVFSSIL